MKDLCFKEAYLKGGSGSKTGIYLLLVTNTYLLSGGEVLYHTTGQYILNSANALGFFPHLFHLVKQDPAIYCLDLSDAICLSDTSVHSLFGH